ncbi:MAG: alpha/beta hydrolase [Gammaproteobacteria bacterium]|nr:alpha/beta hydrolase [Gammaproteobacteria bacterium]
MTASSAQILQRYDGNTVAYHHTPGQQPGILFCGGFNSDMQGHKALALEAHCREHNRQFTRFDYFGHGESSGTFEDGTIGRWADDAIAVLEQVTEGPQLIVGSSMGGWMMLLASLACPQRVVGLVGVAAAPDFTEQMTRSALTPAQLAELAEQGFTDIPNCYDDQEPYRIRRTLIEEGREHLLLDREIAIDVPVRLIHGQQDPDVPWQCALELMERLRTADVEVQLLKSGDHRLSEPEDLSRLCTTIERLLDRL